MTEFCEEQPGFLLHGFSLQLNSDCSDTHLGSLKRPVYNVFRNVNSRHHVPLSSELAYIAESIGDIVGEYRPIQQGPSRLPTLALSTAPLVPYLSRAYCSTRPSAFAAPEMHAVAKPGGATWFAACESRARRHTVLCIV